MELYLLKMEEGCNLHDQINAFNPLVCQLLNADNKIEHEDIAIVRLITEILQANRADNACWEDHAKIR